MWPFSQPNYFSKDSKKNLDYLMKPLKAVMVFNDSTDWGRDLQILTDVLLDKDPSKKNKTQLPLYFSNPDILWSTDHPQPRFGQGAFKLLLEKLMKVKKKLCFFFFFFFFFVCGPQICFFEREWL